ncbi:cytochrome P450 [Natrialbaceae archaeon AArc-T1-2]|uniref:cytochrome P450 n=1 Tax=Natrialbaceae archaeon AArc-T1-2 TaxID=3053904 RepID=UPI00255ABB2F|nr:cytochrome P450 [Natrialbaceae archaeon AArc-T1-2]WIV66431.1 cytochrome P450 [Natrialbaceae archaeon AArc-T1-2]
MSESGTPPTPDGMALLGHGLAFARNPTAALEQWAAHGDVVRLRLLGESIYLVTGPDEIETILVDDQHAFTIGTEQQATFQGIEDHAMTTATGERWKRLRRGAHPAVTRERVTQYGDRFGSVTARFLEDWNDGDRIDLAAEMRRLTVQLLGETLLEADLRGREDVVLEATDAFLDRADFSRPGQLLPNAIPTPTEFRFRRAVGRLDAVVDDLLERRRADADAREDVCSILLEAHDRGKLTMAEVRHNLVAFVLAGHESPAGTLIRAWYLLANHPEVTDRLRAEYDRVVDGDWPTAGEYDDLELTRRVIDETLRLYPPTTGVSRQAIEPVTVGEYEFDAGTQFLIPQWVPHRDERFWDEPETFDPSRWKRDADRPEFAYFPFSGGPRRCIGADFARLELVLALATMVDRADLDLEVDEPLTFRSSLQLRIETDITASVRTRF